MVKNLYCVLTPRHQKNPSKIEDFFDSKTTGTLLGEKQFTADNNFDHTKYYGKALFAEQVVAKHANTIDFSGFVPLLTNVSAVIAEHSQSIVAIPTPPESVVVA